MDDDQSLAHLDDNERSCVRRYLSLVASALGDNLIEVWLFGSAARGDLWSANMPMHSDIDLLVLTTEDLSPEAREKLINETYPLFLECGRQISPAFKMAAPFLASSEERVRELRQVVAAEGRCLYAVSGSPLLSADPIYHIVPESELRAGVAGDTYKPVRFDADGFVHCAATPASVLAVAKDYFANIDGRLLVLRIDPVRLTAKLIFEAPAPIAGGGSSHLRAGDLFPHVYGPIALAAISGMAQLVRRGGEFSWPGTFSSFGAFDL
jgi:uncharacterized protein (DUF952 family)/predicted nucleotidyltransferase